MKFECRAEKIKNKITLADKVTGKNLSLPVLSLIVLEVKNGTLFIRATNLDVGVEFKVPVKTQKNGIVAVPGGIIGSYVASLNPDDTINIETVGNNLSITTNNSSTLIKTHPAEDFPTLPKAKDKGTTKIDSNTLINGLRSVWFSVSTSDIKPEISSIFMSAEDGYVTFAATDSFRLAEKRIKHKNVDIDSVLIPHKNALEIIRFFEGTGGDLHIGLDKGQVSLENDDVYFTSRLTDGIYPDYKQIIPAKFKTQAIVLGKDIKDSLKTANVFTDEFNKTHIRIISEDGLIEVESKNTSVGENVTNMSCNIEGESIEMGFNHKYISEVLQFIDTDSVAFKFNGTNKPVVISGVGDTTFTYLVMPVNR